MSSAPPENRYTVKAARQILQVAEFLAQGEILEWKSVREVAAGAGIKENMSYRLLETLVAAEWAEKGPKGYRQNSAGIIKHSAYTQDYLNRKLAENRRGSND